MTTVEQACPPASPSRGQRRTRPASPPRTPRRGSTAATSGAAADEADHILQHRRQGQAGRRRAATSTSAAPTPCRRSPAGAAMHKHIANRRRPGSTPEHGCSCWRRRCHQSRTSTRGDTTRRPARRPAGWCPGQSALSATRLAASASVRWPRLSASTLSRTARARRRRAAVRGGPERRESAAVRWSGGAVAALAHSHAAHVAPPPAAPAAKPRRPAVEQQGVEPGVHVDGTAQAPPRPSPPRRSAPSTQAPSPARLTALAPTATAPRRPPSRRGRAAVAVGPAALPSRRPRHRQPQRTDGRASLAVSARGQVGRGTSSAASSGAASARQPPPQRPVRTGEQEGRPAASAAGPPAGKARPTKLTTKPHEHARPMAAAVYTDGGVPSMTASRRQHRGSVTTGRSADLRRRPGPRAEQRVRRHARVVERVAAHEEAGAGHQRDPAAAARRPAGRAAPAVRRSCPES